MVEAQLSRLRLTLENTFELDSTASIFALVAQGQGWTITTPGNYARTRRFKSQLRLMAFPRSEFSRTIAIFVGDDRASGVAKLVSSALRSLLATHSIGPVLEEYPWLKDQYRLFPEGEAIQGS